MSQKIDPDSIHLGGVSKEYYAEYVPIPKSEQPESCALPASISLNLTPAPLLPLNEACAFTFPSVLALPPVYNPPQVKFLACETLTAETDITTCAAASSSHLSLIASGPTASEEKDGAASCSLTLAGNICVNACEDFTTNYSVNFSPAMRGSTFKVTPRSIPNCGLDLEADFQISACTDFDVTSSIGYLHAAKSSRLTLTAKKPPHCGLDLSGVIDAVACETFDAIANINVSGPLVKSSNWSLSKTNVPDCGFLLTGDVVLDGCKDFTADGVVNVSGSGAGKGQIRLIPKPAPNCGVTLVGDVSINACKEFQSLGAISISGKPVSGAITVTSVGAPNCGVTFGGNVVIDACDEITAAGSVTVSSSRGGGSGNISLVQGGKCGATLNGSISITACNEVTAGGSVSVISTRGEASGIVQLVAGGNGCGVDLVGSIEVNACDRVTFTTNSPENRPITYKSNKGRTLGSSTFTPYLFANGLDECSVQLEMELFTDKTVTLDTDLTVTETPLGSTDGCCYDEETDAPRLKLNEKSNTLTLEGSLPVMKFVCDEGQCGGSAFVKSSIELASLQVDEITTSSCCNTGSSLNLCGGELYLDGNGSFTSITPANVTGYSSSGPGFEISGGFCNVYGSEGDCKLFPGAIQAGDSSSSFTLGWGQLSLEDSSGGSFTVGYGNLNLTSGGGGSLSVSPTRDMFVTSINICVGDQIKTMDVIGSAIY